VSAWEEAGKSDDWWTPAYVFDAMGVIFDLDVAAPLAAKTHVPCHDWFFDRGLERHWDSGVLIYMNPPFGGRNGVKPWLDKFFAHGNGVALVPDRTSAPWFQEAARKASLVLFVSPKIRFERPDGSVGKSPGCGTALMSAGSRGDEALRNAARAELGWLCRGA
jgi:hypothetical protein